MEGRVHNGKSGKRDGLLYLLATTDRWMEREEIAGLLWQHSREERARAALRQLVRGLRSHPGAMALERRAGRLRWSGTSDLRVMRAALDAGDDARVLELGRGRFLEGIRPRQAPGFEAWIEHQRMRIQDTVRDAGLRHGRRLLQRGAAQDAAAIAQRLLATDGYDEDALRLRVQSLTAAGNAVRAAMEGRSFAEKLERELGMTPSAATVALVEQAIPAEPSPRRGGLIGREEVLDAIGHTVEHSRITTIVGPPGIGKSAVARAWVAGREGARWTSCGDVRSLEDLAVRCSAALGLRVRANDPTRAIAVRLAEDSEPLVLDDVPTTREVVHWLERLVGGPRAGRLLVTARVPLGAQGESPIRLGGLPLEARPEEASQRRSAGTACSPAEALFWQAAAVPAPPNADDAAAAQAICHSLGGSPLAIRLAAGWLRLMSVRELRDGLRSNLGLLDAATGGLTTLIDDGWAVLTDQDRSDLIALSVFRGPFTVADGAAVAGTDLARLARLWAVGWLDRDHRGHFVHHPLLVRAARSHAGPGIDPAAKRHATLVAERLHELVRPADLPTVVRQLDGLTTTAGDLRAAWAWAVEGPEIDLLSRAWAGYVAFLDLRGSPAEINEVVRRALDAMAAVPVASRRVRLLRAALLASFEDAAGRTERMRRAASELVGTGSSFERGWVHALRARHGSRQRRARHLALAMTIAERLTPERVRSRLIAEAELQFGQGLLFLDGDIRSALQHLQRARGLLAPELFPLRSAHADGHMSYAAFLAGDHTEARRGNEAARSTFAALGDRFFLARSVELDLQLSTIEGDLARARRELEAFTRLLDEASDRPSLYAAEIAYAAGDARAAAATYAACLADSEQCGAHWTTAAATMGLARCRFRLGMWEDGVRTLLHGVRTALEIDAQRFLLEGAAAWALAERLAGHTVAARSLADLVTRTAVAEPMVRADAARLRAEIDAAPWTPGPVKPDLEHSRAIAMRVQGMLLRGLERASR